MKLTKNNILASLIINFIVYLFKLVYVKKKRKDMQIPKKYLFY